MREKIISFKANPESVDVENRVIRNAILAKAGEAKGHGFSIEQKFITDLVAQCNNGLLSNFGHNRDNMGLQLGRAKQVRCEGDTAVGDLYIYQNADNSPRFQGMGTWVLNQAKEDPSSIMLSIRFIPSHFYQYDANGKETILRTDWWGDPTVEFKDRPVYCALRQMKSVDVVDEGALTETMFANPKEENGFFSRLFSLLSLKNMKDTDFERAHEAAKRTPGPDEDTDNLDLHNRGGGTNDGAIIWVAEKQFKAADIMAMLEEITALKSGDGEMRSKIDLLKQKVGQLETKNAELEAENTELKAEPNGELTNGDTGGALGGKKSKKADPEMDALALELRAKAGF